MKLIAGTGVLHVLYSSLKICNLSFGTVSMRLSEAASGGSLIQPCTSVMKRLILLGILFASPAVAQTAGQFTNGSMTATTTTIQTITENITTTTYGGKVQAWNGDNVQPSTTIEDASATFSVVDSAKPWSLEFVTRDAGVVETTVIDRVIDTESVTESLSIFSQ